MKRRIEVYKRPAGGWDLVATREERGRLCLSLTDKGRALCEGQG